MANEKNIKARVQLKHDIEANWNLATNFRPMAGEMIIYDPDETYSYRRYKIGEWVDDDKTQTKLLSELSFEPFIHLGDTAPENAPTGTIWIDTSEFTTSLVYSEEYEAQLDEIINLQESYINGEANE